MMNRLVKALTLALTLTLWNEGFARPSPGGAYLEDALLEAGATQSGNVYTLNDDFRCPYATIEFRGDIIVDLNGYSFFAQGADVPVKCSVSVTFINSSSHFNTFLLEDFSPITGRWTIGENVGMYITGVWPFDLESPGSITFESGSVLTDWAWGDYYTKNLDRVYFEEGSKVSEDAWIKITDADPGILYVNIPLGCSWSSLDQDGYYTVVKPQPEINLISAAQRYPWNNIVDYTYSLTNCNASATYKLAIDLTMNGVKKSVTNELTTVADGTYNGTINLADHFSDGTKDPAGKMDLTLIETK